MTALEFSKLPMRQLTQDDFARAIARVSKLPMRQLTLHLIAR